MKVSNPGIFLFYSHPHRSYTAVFHAERNSHAIGPSLSWDASLPVTGSDNGMAVALNWGANAAVLFGRRKVKTHHQTEGVYNTGYTAGNLVSVYTHEPYPHDRARAVTIPNFGGFAGLSFRYTDAKLDLGCRADFFFNAIDSGIDTRRSETLGFYGPFASVSVGLGG